MSTYSQRERVRERITKMERDIRKVSPQPITFKGAKENGGRQNSAKDVLCGVAWHKIVNRAQFQLILKLTL